MSVIQILLMTFVNCQNVLLRACGFINIKQTTRNKTVSYNAATKELVYSHLYTRLLGSCGARTALHYSSITLFLSCNAHIHDKRLQVWKSTISILLKIQWFSFGRYNNFL